MMPNFKCQTLLNNLHQKKYHYFKDDDIIRHIYNKDNKEWYALSCTKELLQFYLDYPNSGVPYDTELLDGDRMMEHYDNLFYRVARNRSRMLTLSPLIFENIHYTGEIERVLTEREIILKSLDDNYSQEEHDYISNCKKINEDEVRLIHYPLTWVVGVFYVAWVVILCHAPGIPLWELLAIITLGAPFYIASVVISLTIVNFVTVLLYDIGLEGMNQYYFWRHTKSEYGKLEKKQAEYRAARLAASKKT